MNSPTLSLPDVVGCWYCESTFMRSAGLVLFWYLPLKRSQDFAITLAGPMANLAIALVTLVLLASVPLEPTTIEIDGRIFFVLGTEKGFLEQLLRGSAYLNLGLCAVNLIPAFPLDGGKLVYLVITPAALPSPRHARACRRQR